jgi:hypothetical protein
MTLLQRAFPVKAKFQMYSGESEKEFICGVKAGQPHGCANREYVQSQQECFDG